jgi:hypothetical protein
MYQCWMLSTGQGPRHALLAATAILQEWIDGIEHGAITPPCTPNSLIESE